MNKSLNVIGKIKYITLFVLSALPIHAEESTYKHTQKYDQQVESNITFKAEIELEMNSNFKEPINYEHIQTLISFKNKYLNIEPGVRVSYKKQIIVYIPMIDLRKRTSLYDVPLSNRLRYMYEMPEDKSDTYIIRYKIGSIYELPFKFEAIPSAELFINDNTDVYRVRYGAALERKISNWYVSLGLEYNDNIGKSDTFTYVSEIGCKF